MSESRFEESVTFYADRQKDEKKRTALNIQYSVREKSKELTVNVEMAKILQFSNEAEWSNKIYLQLSKHELTDFCELLFGLKKSIEFNYHGPNKNKGLTVHNNDAKGVMLVISEAGNTLQHLLSHHQRIELGVFIIRRQAMAWKISVSDVLAILRQSSVISRTVINPKLNV
ncbi:hypothetical protein [Xenorhabdus sp. KJ12.1]|uniref:hypothetical protein n=1 Tax=Xenorhabdus sp. KJ12.1 TaxID=1851571 RepID=UPI000C0424D9|nr:hypothetical protein [Xenorhabdus sp. KJ12.1]PHM72282.1 hypothetical protein Xekj_00560 [Xenorhabdus sp. KJ12.1]